MNYYRKRSDGSLVTQSQLVAEHSNTSLPKVWTASTLDFLDVDPVLAGSPPALGPYDVAAISDPVLSGDVWVMGYTVTNTFVEYTNEEGVVVTEADQVALDAANRVELERAKVSITMRQCRLALLAAGLLDSVDTALASLPEPDKSVATIAWEYGASVERLSAFVVGMGPLLGLSDLEIDALFEGAKDL